MNATSIAYLSLLRGSYSPPLPTRQTSLGIFGVFDRKNVKCPCSLTDVNLIRRCSVALAFCLLAEGHGLWKGAIVSSCA